jgi:hypothetical protein
MGMLANRPADPSEASDGAQIPDLCCGGATPFEA